LEWSFKEKDLPKLVKAIESERRMFSLALENNSKQLLHQISIQFQKRTVLLGDLREALKLNYSSIQILVKKSGRELQDNRLKQRLKVFSLANVDYIIRRDNNSGK
jgi:hypothetical protein